MAKETNTITSSEVSINQEENTSSTINLEKTNSVKKTTTRKASIRTKNPINDKVLVVETNISNESTEENNVEANASEVEVKETKSKSKITIRKA
ncbi:MAG: hypothetical protein IE891_04865 [Flavobacteriaceae bacterium]|nr:hypothetical protein [Flavobacteriaceae bacterium]